ncbi:energy transducer TonB [Chitinimonas arctica]|uniref:Energy transducer TonB n=1 Tax=Chitinimonas arctica TaxID=2594795 RepID=A0A516SIV9_9NEIS|nr:energy transducer TonB [Chitinimonas arctica]QDQ27978.1 energy transducer TonB [Chitinimonas arctica]
MSRLPIDFRRLPTLLLVTGLHFVALYGLALGIVLPTPPVLPKPTIVASLLPPQPLPLVVPEATPQPAQRPLPVSRPKPTMLPPIKNAPPSPTAISLPPAELAPQQPIAPESPKLAQAPAQPLPPAPIVPPRSDASHLNNPAPTYPPLSRRLGEEGRVVLSVYILPDGKVGEAVLKKSSGFERLDQAALDVVKRWRYVPAKQGDTPIAFWYAQPFDFTLNS